jgi:hypothetical protein
MDNFNVKGTTKSTSIYLLIKMYNKFILLKRNRSFFLSSFIFYIFILIYTYFISDPIFQFYEIEGYDDSFRDLDDIGIFSALLIAPVLEELIFRGYLTGYRKHFLFIIPQIIILFILLYKYFILISLISAFLIFLFYYDKKRSEDLISNQLLYFSIFFTSILPSNVL